MIDNDYFIYRIRHSFIWLFDIWEVVLLVTLIVKEVTVSADVDTLVSSDNKHFVLYILDFIVKLTVVTESEAVRAGRGYLAWHTHQLLVTSVTKKDHFVTFLLGKSSSLSHCMELLSFDRPLYKFIVRQCHFVK